MIQASIFYIDLLLLWPEHIYARTHVYTHLYTPTYTLTHIHVHTAANWMFSSFHQTKNQLNLESRFSIDQCTRNTQLATNHFDTRTGIRFEFCGAVESNGVTVRSKELILRLNCHSPGRISQSTNIKGSAEWKLFFSSFSLILFGQSTNFVMFKWTRINWGQFNT